MMQRWLGLGLVVAGVIAQVACSQAAGPIGPPAGAPITGERGAESGGFDKGSGHPTRAGGGEGQSEGAGGAAAASTSTDSNTTAGSGSTGTGASLPNGEGGRDPGPPPTPVACVQAKESVEAIAAAQHLDSTTTRAFYESADDSNSMGSPALAREMLRAGLAPDPATVRTYEFLNYYRVRRQAAKPGQIELFADAEVSGADALTVALQVGVRAYAAPESRRPVRLTVALDASGSMAGTGIARERALVRALAKSLRKGDVVSVLTWSVDDAVLLSSHHVTGADDPAVVGVAEALRADGGSDLHGALDTAYQLAHASYDKDSMNRVVLVSDGGANLGVVDSAPIQVAATDSDHEGIYLAGVGVGPASGYSDAFMNAVTDAGRGAYVYLDSVEEAEHMFVDRFQEIIGIAARGVRVRLDVPYWFDIADFYGEGYSSDPALIDPQHLAVGSEMIFQQNLSRCAAGWSDPSLPNEIRVTATYDDPITLAAHQPVTQTFGVDELFTQSHATLHKAEAIVAYAEALKLADPSPKQALQKALERVQSALAEPELAKDPELLEIASLLPKHPLLAKSAK
jgi:Ca-activated chloride channel family protein